MTYTIPIIENYPYFFWRVLKKPKALKKFFATRDLPEILWIETTNRCNMRCRSCSKFYGLGDSTTDMKLGLLKKIISEAAPHVKTIILTGIGEALYHKNAAEIFELLFQYHNFHLEFTTNGMLFNEEWIQKFSNINCSIIFSIDGVDNDVFCLNRPGGDFEHIDLCLRRIREIESSSSAPDAFPFKCRVNYLIMRYNMHQIKDMIHLAKEYNLELLIFGLLNNWGCPEEFWAEQNPLNYREELIHILDEARGIAASLGVNAIIPNIRPLAPASDNNSLSNTCVKSNPLKKAEKKYLYRERFLSHFLPTEATKGHFPRFEDRECVIPYNSMYIRADGKTSFCCASWHKQFGDVNTHTIKEIWNSFQYGIRRIAMSAGAHTSYCRTCDLPYGLAGGNPRDSL